MFQLPTRSETAYRGKYPHRIRGWGYSQSACQKAIGEFLGIKKPVHIDTNEGRRYIADISELQPNRVTLGVDLETVLAHKPTILIELTRERYDQMIELVRSHRELL